MNVPVVLQRDEVSSQTGDNRELVTVLFPSRVSPAAHGMCVVRSVTLRYTPQVLDITSVSIRTDESSKLTSSQNSWHSCLQRS